MRVRLVRPLLAEIAQLDTLATAQAPGYDPDFQEPRAGARQNVCEALASVREAMAVTPESPAGTVLWPSLLEPQGTTVLPWA